MDSQSIVTVEVIGLVFAIAAAARVGLRLVLVGLYLVRELAGGRERTASKGFEPVRPFLS